MNARGADGLVVGAYALTVTKSGYEETTRNFAVTRGRITDVGEIPLKEVGGLSMRAPGQDAWIRWTEGVSSFGWGTYEFWFRPTAWGYMEYGNALAEISRDYPDWMGQGPHRWPIMRIQYASAEADPNDVVVEFAMNENKGDEHGAWHRVKATTPMELGRWYHVAAVYGESGMKLFVNGHLEGSNDYAGIPEANEGPRPTAGSASVATTRSPATRPRRRLQGARRLRGGDLGLRLHTVGHARSAATPPRLRPAPRHDQRRQQRVRADAVTGRVAPERDSGRCDEGGAQVSPALVQSTLEVGVRRLSSA